MDYKFTFQDGSEALMHYGVKGMKWGVRNADTRARRIGESISSPSGGGAYVEDEDESRDAEKESFDLLGAAANTLGGVADTVISTGKGAVDAILGVGKQTANFVADLFKGDPNRIAGYTKYQPGQHDQETHLLLENGRRRRFRKDGKVPTREFDTKRGDRKSFSSSASLVSIR